MAGLTVSTSPGFKPVHNPVQPFSCTISDPTSSRDLELELSAICCRRAITDTGIVNIWARAPASAPRASSWGVDNAVERRLRRAVRREE